MSSQPFDIDFLAGLLAQPDRSPRSRKKPDTRDYDTWFKLDHRVAEGYCSNDKCVGVGKINSVTHKPKTREQITSIVNGHEMCRYCFLSMWHYDPTNQ